VLRPLAGRPRFPPIEYDPPEHIHWRKLFAQALNPATARVHRRYTVEMHAAAGLMWEVLRDPRLKRRLIDDPAPMPAAIEESLRLHTPCFGLYRTTTQGVTVGGVEIPSGSSVLLMWAAANRDPKVFPEPHRFVLDRDARRTRVMSFGFGIHACMGQPLARMEMRVALSELFTRLPNVERSNPTACATSSPARRRR
jgi:cytochrome P450